MIERALKTLAELEPAHAPRQLHPNGRTPAVSPCFPRPWRARSHPLRRKELMALRALADELFGLDGPDLEVMLANGTISEVKCNG